MERDVFRKLLEFKDEARVLAIKGGEGTGKTTLLRRLQYDCEWIYQLDCVLISLEVETVQTPFNLTHTIRKGLRDLQFTLYDGFNEARASKQTVVKGQAQIVIKTERIEWSSEQEELARERCVEAFFSDLKSIADQEPVVILLDSYDERCASGLRQWILSSFVRPLCFDEGRPEKLVLVLAGRPGEGMPDFDQLAGGEYKPFITSIRSLPGSMDGRARQSGFGGPRLWRPQ